MEQIENLREIREEWYEKHKESLGEELALILSTFKLKMIDGGYVSDPIKYVLTHPPAYTAVCMELGTMDDKEIIETPLEWLDKITKAERIDERTLEGRRVVYIETDIGKITVESHYGFLYRIEDDGKKWEFSDAAFNSVKDSDVTPK